MEFAIVVALSWWGYHATEGVARYVLAVLAPTVGFGVWGSIDFRNAGASAERLRLLQELAISGLAALAWYASGEQALGLGLAALSLLHHVLVYLLGDRLLKRKASPTPQQSR